MFLLFSRLCIFLINFWIEIREQDILGLSPDLHKQVVVSVDVDPFRIVRIAAVP